MKELKLLILFILLSLKIHSQKTSPIQIGETVEIESKYLKESRKLHIYLPLDFEKDSQESYSVFYLLDGGLDQDFLHISGIVQFLSYPWIGLLPPSILVAIENVDRTRDFTFPTEISVDKKDFPNSGGSANFINFLEHEVKPLIQKYYRANEEKTLIGQSFGGLLAAEILLSKSAMFDNYIIVSPSLWWNKQSLLKLPIPDDVETKSVFIGVAKEGEVMENDARSLFNKINKHENVYFQFFEEQNHGDALHLAVYSAFEKLFKSESK